MALDLSRRQWLAAAAASSVGLASGGGCGVLALAKTNPLSANDPNEALVPIRCLTRGPKFHWFGYYDKFEFDVTNRYVLSNEVSFEHRTPRADDVIGVGMVDTADGDRWMPLGESRSWGWQQGCMIQWRPGSPHEVLWNDRDGDRFVCHVLNVQTQKKRTIPRAIYTISPDGKWAIATDFARIDNMRPGYGYAGGRDPYADLRAPQNSGIWRIDLDTGEEKLLVPLAAVAELPHLGKSLAAKWHYFNHLLINPDGTRFIFLHRWRDAPNYERKNGGFTTRMFTANADGSGLYVLDPSGNTSHFIWRDPQHVCAWTQPVGKKAAFYLFTDQSDALEIVGDGHMPVNGHNTYLPVTGQAGQWILNDTYPQGSLRQQIPYLYHLPTGRRFDLGRFHLPTEYAGEWRCDTHPRASRDGRLVAIDSPHGGQGRQIWLLDVSAIIAG